MLTTRERHVVAAFFFALTLLTVGYVAALEEGTRAPEIAGTDLEGNRFQLSQARGKVVVVDFWASWCQPCGDAMPALDRLYRQYKDHGLVVVGVNVDREERNARQFLRRTRVSFPVVHDESHSLADRYAPPTMPSTYVIDRRGVVRHVHAGFRQGDARSLETMIRGLL
jgi:peroxiredoxin